MNHLLTKIVYLTLFSLFLASCIPQSRIGYMQDPVMDSKTYTIDNIGENEIKPNDELYITVSSIDDPVFNFLGGQTGDTRTGFGSDLAIALITYTVQSDGYISYPVLGKVHLAGLTLEEATVKLEEMLQSYLNQPTVKIKFGFKKVTVIGEVLRPGNYTYSKNKINILEAISMSGDLTIHGNRKKVYLLRQSDNTLTKTRIDLTRDDQVFSSSFIIQPDDVIYVAPRRSVRWNVNSTPIQLILSTLTTGILVLNYIERQAN